MVVVVVVVVVVVTTQWATKNFFDMQYGMQSRPYRRGTEVDVDMWVVK